MLPNDPGRMPGEEVPHLRQADEAESHEEAEDAADGAHEREGGGLLLALVLVSERAVDEQVQFHEVGG